MHPIERLRYVARAGSAPDRLLVAEAVPAFSAFTGNPGALLVSLRQLIGRQPESPGLLVLAARMLGDLDPLAAAWAFVDELDSDPTDEHADRLVVEERGGVEVIETIASGAGLILGPPGARTWIDDAHQRGRTVAATTPLGSRLPPMLWRGFVERLLAGSVGPALETIEMSAIDELVGPDGVQAPSTWSPDCSDVAELASF